MLSSHTIHAIDECHSVLRFNAPPSVQLLREMLCLKNEIKKQTGIQLQHTYQEILIPNELLILINTYITTSITEVALYNKRVTLPVCYDLSLETDLACFALRKNLSTEAVITAHTTPSYTVYFNGFLPGFPYLLGLDPLLHHPRKANPTRSILAGSVAIGGNQTGVYPQASPAGWWSLGICPLSLFDTSTVQTLLEPGDVVAFESITLKKYNTLKRKKQDSLLMIKSKPYVW